MLVRSLFKNFLSYYDGVEFNMLPNPKRKRFNNHIYTNYNTPVLKVAALYGANGAGKSNLLKGLSILNWIVVVKEYVKEEDVYNNYRFLLANNTDKKPISIGVEFINQDRTFYYRVDIMDSYISKEELYVYKVESKEEVPVFVCNGIGDDRKLKLYDENGVENDSYVDDRTIELLKKNPSSSIMYLHNEFPIIFNKDAAEIAYNWFSMKLSVVPIRINRQHIIDVVDKSVELKSYINKQISEMSLGVKFIDVKTSDLASVFADRVERDDEVRKQIIDSLKSETESNSALLKMKRDRPLFSIAKDEDGRDVVKELVFSQSGVDGYVGDMNIDSQSEGTVALLSKLPLLYRLAKQDCVIFIDEIESSLHPQLIEKFLKLFLDDKNSKGQLIFTTHEVHLLDQHKLLRADEVWFAEKEYGKTSLYSLNDFKEHNTIDIAKGYLAGRYGAIPFAGSAEILNESGLDE